MTDITPQLNDLFKPHGTHTKSDWHYSLDQLNAFLREAYQINTRTSQLLAYLRSIRRPYLSTAPPPRRRLHPSLSTPQADTTPHLTDADREIIDSDSKAALSTLHASLSQLRAAESARLLTVSKLTTARRTHNAGGALGRWAMGGAAHELTPEEKEQDGRAESLRECREGVFWFLERGLEECGRFQSDMISVRITREVEKGKSMLFKSRGGGPIPVWDDPASSSLPPEPSTSTADNDVQLALLQENQDMIKHYESKLDQVRTAESSLLEIAALQNQLSVSLSTQAAQIEQLIGDSLSTGENIGTGNKELKKASERKSTAKAIFWGTVVGCGFFVVWDLIL